MRAEIGQNVALFDISLKCVSVDLNFSLLSACVCEWPRECKCVDLGWGGYEKFWWVGELADMEFINKKDQPYMCYIRVVVWIKSVNQVLQTVPCTETLGISEFYLVS